MADGKTRWWRDLLLIPIMVGAVIAFFTYALPNLADKGKQLSYTIEGPTPVLTRSQLGNLTITVNGVPASQLFTYRVKIWNSGDIALKNVPVRLVLNGGSRNFKIFSVGHATIPAFEFGAIKEEIAGDNARRFTYALLNPESQDQVTITANEKVTLGVYAHIEGVRVRHIEPEAGGAWSALAAEVLSVFGAAIAIFTIFLKNASAWLASHFSSRTGGDS